jgi:hypothetical protein
MSKRSLGGCFGLGWIRDLRRLPEYVNAANKNPDYLKDLNEKVRRYPSPTFNEDRFAGELIVGFLFGALVQLAILMVSKYIQKLTVTGDRSSVDVGLMIIGLENMTDSDPYLF